MPAAKKAASRSQSTAAKRPRRTSAQGEAERTIKRFEKSLDEAQAAIRALGKDVGKGGRDLYRDIETLLKSAKRDAGKANRAALKDLGKLGAAVTPATARRARPTARKTSTKQSRGAKRTPRR